MKLLSNANIEVLQQVQELVSGCQAIYLKQTSTPHAGIGQHVRHVLDHYLAFQQGYEMGQIDYNRRNRHSLVETQPKSASELTAQLIQWFQNTQLINLDMEIISEISLSVQSSTRVHSNAERELLYLINHSIHHMAYASLLASSRGVELPRHIGLAPGTASYERQQQHQEATEHA